MLPVQECCWLQESAVPILTGKEPGSNPVLTAGSPVKENYWFRSGAGSRVLLVTWKSTVPMLTDKKPASNPVLTTGSLVTEVYRLQKFTGDKLVGQEVLFRKFL